MHGSAIRVFTRPRPPAEQRELISDMEASIRAGENNYFFGLPETLAALSSTKLKYILFWEKLFINSATYRNPLSGKTITMHTLYSPSTVIQRNYTDPETGCFMELVQCWPFPRWVTNYYKYYVPTLTRLEARSDTTLARTIFARVSEGIGGRLTEPL